MVEANKKIIQKGLEDLENHFENVANEFKLEVNNERSELDELFLESKKEI